MNKFKIGDAVKYTSNNWGDTFDNPLWGSCWGEIVGIVKETYNNHRKHGIFDVSVNWNNGGFAFYENKDLELIKEAPGQLKLF